MLTLIDDAIMAEASNYRYSALPADVPTIRLIQVSHTSDGQAQAASYSLEDFAVASAPPYDAISYTWGPPFPERTIWIAGQRLVVRESCNRVLAQISQLGASKYAWIDAVCINQCDTPERNSQVAMMDSIYRNAQKVLACLDSADEDILAAMSAMKCSKLGVEAAETAEAITEASRERVFEKLSPTERTHCYRGLVKLTSLPYFGRVWITQELQLARHAFFCCGCYAVPARTLSSQLLTILFFSMRKATERESRSLAEATNEWDPLHIPEVSDQFEDADPDAIPRKRIGSDTPPGLAVVIDDFATDISAEATSVVATTSSMTKGHNSGMTLWDSVREVKSKCCQDPRDRLYGMLALIDWQGRAPLKPDYRLNALELAVSLCRYDLGGPVARQLTRNLRLDANHPAVVEAILRRQDAQLHTSQSQAEKLRSNIARMSASLGRGTHRQSYVGERMSGVHILPGEKLTIPQEDAGQPYRRLIRTGGTEADIQLDAVVSRSFEWGDWIAQNLDTGISYPSADALILRQLPGSSTLFAIVGRAIAAKSTFVSRSRSYFEGVFDAEDFFVYAATSSFHVPSGSWRASPLQLALDQIDMPSLAIQLCKEPGSSIAMRRDGEKPQWLFDMHLAEAEIKVKEYQSARMQASARSIRLGNPSKETSC